MTDNAIEMRTIENLRELGEDLLLEVVEIFGVQAPERVMQIEKAAAAGDAETVWKSAHELRSVAANAGAMGLARLCDEAQELGVSGSLGGIDRVIRDLHTETDRATRELRRISGEKPAAP